MMPYEVENLETEQEYPLSRADYVPSRIMNWDEFPVVKPEKSESVSTVTYVDVGIIVQPLSLDPLRTKATFFISGVGTVTLCHSENQAQDVINRGIANNTSGSTIQCPGGATGSISFSTDHTAPMWAVLLGASPALGVITERRSGR